MTTVRLCDRSNNPTVNTVLCAMPFGDETAAGANSHGNHRARIFVFEVEDVPNALASPTTSPWPSTLSSRSRPSRRRLVVW
jgi:hypothetical protein